MDVRSIEDVEPVVEHNGTVPVWWLFKSREMKKITDGGFLELVNEFEVAGGGYVDPHSHPTHEFYYVTSGRGIMTIDGEDREVEGPGPHGIPGSRPGSSEPVRARSRTFIPAALDDNADRDAGERSGDAHGGSGASPAGN